VSDIEQVDGLDSKTMTMVNDQEKHKTVFHVQHSKSIAQIDDDSPNAA